MKMVQYWPSHGIGDLDSSSFFLSVSATKRREDDFFDFNVHISKFIFGFFPSTIYF